jgi:hypothetical protein
MKIDCNNIPFNDKGCHFIVGALITLSIFILNNFGLVCCDERNDIVDMVILASIITFGVAILKEEYDRGVRGTFFDAYDIYATLLGSLTISLCFLIYSMVH